MDKKHIDLLLSISELDWVFDGRGDIESLLQKVVSIVSRHMKSDVCSIYLYDENTQLLTLKASAGLPKEAIGTLTLKLGEGLVGKSLKELSGICVRDGFSHPDFKHIEGINEELYNSYLVTPIFRGISRIGVLILQRKERNYFAADDETAIKAIASQLANIMENAKLLLQKNGTAGKILPRKRAMIKSCIIKGKAAAGGFAFAKAHRIDTGAIQAQLSTVKFEKAYTLADLESAIFETEKQLVDMRKKAESYISDAGALIFTAHILILKDKGFLSGVRKLIEGGENPPVAVMKVAKTYSDIFAGSQNQSIREKTQDVADLVKRIVANIVGMGEDSIVLKNKVIVAGELYPSDILKYFAQGIAGAVLTSGGVTSHVAILARSLKIPLVIADSPELDGIGPGNCILLDADIGNIYINPSGDVVRHFTESNKAKARIKKVSAGAKKAETADGRRINLMINVNLLRDIDAAKKLPCDGIGLYRTEFPFILRSAFPTEEEQYIVYRKLLEEAGGLEVTFRTLDVGGDKVLAYYHTQKEENPFLGMRSIRFSLGNKDIFRQQINAILRAGYDKNIRVMFPMVSSIDEFREAKIVLDECVADLEKRKVPFNGKPKIGIMVEIPSVIAIIDSLAAVCDYFSIGTNDLIQYTLAVDRTNEKVARYYLPHHPAVLRSLQTVAGAAIKRGIGVSVCGDMANNPAYIPFLLGIGIREMSVDPVYFVKAYESIKRTTFGFAEKFAGELLSRDDIRSTAKLINQLINENNLTGK